MLRPAPARRITVGLSLLTLTGFYGCTDASTPLAPRIPTRPNALAGPIATVTNTDDSGPGSLRDAIAAAVPGTTIQFDAGIAGQTIALSNTPLKVEKQLTIEGPADKGMIISGNLSTGVLAALGDADVVLRNLSIVNGRSQVAAGIALIEGRMTLDHVLVANNEAVSVAGAIGVSTGSELALVNSTITGNVAGFGGAISSAGSLIIRNSTITQNAAVSAGGALHSTSGTITIRNSIIANNTVGPSGMGSNCFFALTPGPTVIHLGHNISNDGTCGTEPKMIVTDPKLAPLAGNGGPTQTHALFSDSPAVDGGTLCTEATDQRYVSRPQSLSCDVGAFEFNDYGTYTIAIGPSIAANKKTGVATVSGTITCSKETDVILRVRLSQTQKSKGKFTTIVQGNALASVMSCGASPVSWSAAVTPDEGAFENGDATSRATTEPTPPGFLIGDVTTPVKLFWVK